MPLTTGRADVPTDLTLHDPVDFEIVYARLYRRLVRWVTAVFGRRRAEDIAQEALIRLYQRPEVLAADDPWPWVSTVARNIGRDLIRRDNIVEFVSIDLGYLADRLPDPTDVQELALAHDDAHRLTQALLQLNGRDRALLGMRHVQCVPVIEMAELIRATPNAVRQQLFRARGRLAEAYLALGGDPRALPVPYRRARRRAGPLSGSSTSPIGRSRDTSRMVTAVVFDWGGTLTPYVHVDPVMAWSRAATGVPTSEHFGMAEALARAEAALWRAAADDPRSGSVTSLLRSVASELGMSLTTEDEAAASDRYLQCWAPHIDHRPEALPTLAALRGTGVKIGLLSNTVWPGSFHDELLDRDGLRQLIDVCHYTSEHDWMKPHPDAFTAVLQQLGVEDPQSAVFVGDRLFDDIFGAQRAGLRTVHLPNPFVPQYDVQPDAQISCLSELLELVERWTSPPRRSPVPA